jgi:hypothetical protein
MKKRDSIAPLQKNNYRLKKKIMFGFTKGRKSTDETLLLLSFYDKDRKKSYEVSYKSCTLNNSAQIKVLDEHCYKVNRCFKKRIPGERLDEMVGHAIRKGFFSLKPIYQGEVKDNHRFIITLETGGKCHTVVDSFGAAPQWLRDFELMMMNECIEGNESTIAV